jgi:hypothetical protein
MVSTAQKNEEKRLKRGGSTNLSILLALGRICAHFWPWRFGLGSQTTSPQLTGNPGPLFRGPQVSQIWV